ncbi:MAG: Cna B-type domain-containing protein [Oscillospiraceae bacterium]|nr:Cna B-type domain-containing protein [Oscillospiraceae bacterium]
MVREISAEGNYATEKTVQVDAPGQQGIVWFDMMAPDDSSWAAGTSVWNVPNEEEAEDWYNLQYQFDTHGASYDGHYHSDRGWVNGNGLLRAYFSHTYYDKVRDGFIVANPRWRGTTAEEVKIPIRTTVREGLEEEAFSRVPEQKLMVSVTSEAEEHAGYVETANSWSGDAYISQTGDSYITVGNLQPGVYYVSYSTHWYYRQNQWYSWWPVFAGWSKSAPAGEKIIVTAEGKVLAEDGSEYFIDNRYFGAVNPKIFVNTTLPEEFSTVNTTLAARLKGVAGTETANVDVFGTVSVTNQELGTYGFYSNPSNYHNYFFRPTDYNSSESYTIPSGDYELSYYTVDPRDAGRNYRDQKSDAWVSGENIRIHIDEEGNVTKDGQSYVIPNYMLPGLSSVTFDVETTVTEGVKEPFTPGDVVVAWLMDGNNRLVAMGQVEISETGTKPITLTAMQGRSIYPGYGLPDDTRYSNSPFYKVNFATFHENEGQQAPPRINDLWHSRLEMSEEPVHGAIPVRVNTDGSVSDATKYKSYQYSSERQESMLEPLKLDNYSLLLPYEGSVEPDAVTQAEDGAIELKPITDLTQITDKSHYMIVVKNRFDNKFYAVSYAEGKGDQVLLEDVNSLEDLEKGYLLNESDLASKAYVFTANKTSYSDSSVNTQLRSGVKDENGKYISVKMGSSAREYKPLLSNSAGTVTIVPEGLASEKSGIFSVNKNRYAFLGYINEFLGYKGYTVYSERYPEVPYIRTEDYSGDTYFYAEGQYVAISNTNNEGVFIAKKPDGMEYLNRFVYEVDEKYGTTAYYEALQGDIPGSISDSGVMYPMDRLVYILSDNQEVQTETPNNNYKLVKTFGDFNNTFVQGYSKDMVLVYTDESGKEYALNPKGLTPVKTKDGSADYRTLTAGADNEYIANNNSRIWDYTNHKETTFFGLMPTDIDGSTNQVFVGEYALRKSRSNDYAEGEYLTLNGNPLGKDDTDYNYEAQTYIFRPTIQVRNQTNWNTKTSYTLSVLRGGVETWLGVEDGKMVLVDSQEKAAVFDVYSTVVDRYYPAANSDEFNPYYKISSLDDINADDEIVIVYNNNGKKEILACTASEYSAGSSGYYYSVYPAVPLSSEDNPVNIATETTYPEDFKYTHRLDTSGDTKHVYAYEVSDNLIMAQGGATNAIGSAKSANKTQEKYDSVVGLGAGAKYKLWIKEPGWTSLIYYGQKAEVNFFCEDGQFYLRGGKSDAWLGFSDYTRQIYNFRTGEYTYITRDCFTTVSKDKRVPVEIYKRGTPESITVNYYDVDNLNGDPKKTETKSEGLLGLPQDADVKHNGEDYIFVGWTRDKEKAGYLGKDESANLYDFDDLSRVASIKQDVKETCGLLGDCNPEASNTFKIQASDLGEDKTLDLYPVYAWRGRTEVVSWDENGTMILGVSDYKDLQAGHDGTVDVRERWLGSIDIEVYRDGVLVKSGSAPSRPSGAPGRRTINAARGGALKANSGDVTARLYFAYHNDDAADLNIKFIADTVTRETLMPYLRDGDFSTTTPSDDYIIDAVYAEQGGSEDGLKYMYNWLDPEVGGQLDNVRGGSTVKIYVTTRYQVKYYYDNGETDGYVELKSEKYLDENYYTTAGTENAINEKKADSDYLVTSESEYSKLLEKTPSDTTRFTDEAIRRGEYSKFLYNFNEYPHVISIPALPEGEEIPEGAVLDSDTWTVRDAKGKAMLYEGSSSVAPSSRLTVTDTTYGTGNTVWSYTDENLDDVTNTYHLYIRVKRDVVDLNVTKKWDDAENQDGIRPAAEDFAASLHLMNGDTEVTGHVPEITDNKDGTYTVTYTELPQYGSGGAEIVYTVKEDAIEGYTADKQTAADGETITNTHTPETTEISVTKKWDDADDRDGIRPTAEDFAASVRLMSGDTEVKDYTPEITDNDDGTYTIRYTGMPKYKAPGEKIVYTVKEDAIEGYTADKQTAADGETITNTHVPGTVEIRVTKKWDDADNQDGIRPAAEDFASRLHLMSGDTEVKDHVPEITDNKDGTFTIRYTELPQRDAGGEEIVYTVKEDAIEGYTADKETVADGETITNTHTPETVEIRVTKKWDDQNDQANKRPKSVTVTLLADGEQTEKTVKLSEENKWTDTFRDLPANKDGRKIVYTVKEEAVSGYTATVSGDAENGFVITNRAEEVNKPTPPDQDGKKPEVKTGDGYHLTVMLAGVILSGAGLLALGLIEILERKKRRQSR